MVLAALPLMTLAPRADATPGQLDQTFSSFGTFGFVGLDQDVMAHAVGPDGKIVLVGYSGVQLRIVRLLPTGNYDATFSGDGVALISNLQYPARARSVAVQSDGKIVVAGYAQNSTNDLLVARITASGVADPTFSGDGFVTTSFSTDSDVAEKVLIQPDGKILAGGRSFIAGDWDFAVARFNPDGTLDATFSGDGKATVGFGGDEQCWDMALQGDGKLLMAGGSINGALADGDFAVARLTTGGALDGSFSGDGKVTTGFTDVDEAFAIAIQPDLRIVVAGRGHMARYFSSDGSLDGSFDGDGKLSISIDPYDLAITPASKIEVLGTSGNLTYLYRLNPNGSFDTSLTGDGSMFVTNGGPDNEPPSLTHMPDGRMLTVLPAGGSCNLLRWWPDGSQDSGGRQAAAFDDVTFPPGSQEIGHALAIQPDGKLVVAGEVATANNAEKDVALARFTSDGQLDMSFGVRGRTELDFSNADVAKSVAIQPDGKIVVAGYEGVGNTNFLVARFNANGTLDNTFGFFGYNVVDFFGGADYGHAVALQPDGKIVVAGPVLAASGVYVFGVARFTSNGVLDNTFSGDGKTIYAWSAPNHWVTSLVVQGSYRIVVGGFVDDDFALVGFTMNGAVDPNFGSSGQRRTNMGGFDYLYALALGPNDAIYAGGTRIVGTNMDIALLQLDSTGRVPLCPIGGCGARWPSGMLFLNWNASQEVTYSLNVRSDGQIVAAGAYGTGWGWAHLSPTTTTPVASGSISFAGSEAVPLGVKFVGADKIVMAGYHNFQNDRNIALARFETTMNTAVGVDDEEPALAPSVQLRAAFPNPLVHQSVIAFDLPRAESVRLRVYDTAGRLVRTLAEGPFSAGRHQNVWDGTDDHGTRLANGAYFARLDAGAESARRTIIVLR